MKVIRFSQDIYSAFSIAYTQQGSEHAKRSGLQSRFTRKPKQKDVSTANQRTKAPKVPSQQVLLLHTSCTVVERMVAQHLARRKQKVRPKTSLSWPQPLEHSTVAVAGRGTTGVVVYSCFTETFDLPKRQRGKQNNFFFATSQVDDGVNPCSIFTKVWLCAWTGERAAAPHGHYSHSR